MGQVFNIGNDREEITILELAQRVKERTGSQSEIVLVPYDKAYEEGFEDMPRRVPDLGKSARLIGYEPQGAPRRDPRPRDRLLHVGQGARLTRGAARARSRHLKKLASHSAVYGAADVFTNVVNFLLIPLYTALPDAGGLRRTWRCCSLFSTVAKIVFRLGLDAGFFRVHYDLDDARSAAPPGGHGGALRGRLVGTLLFAARGRAAAGPLTRAVLGDAGAPRSAGWCWPRPTSSLGTFAFVPLEPAAHPGPARALLDASPRCATPPTPS